MLSTKQIPSVLVIILGIVIFIMGNSQYKAGNITVQQSLAVLILALASFAIGIASLVIIRFKELDKKDDEDKPEEDKYESRTWKRRS